MGSLSSNGQPLTKITNKLSIRHRGDFLTSANAETDTRGTDIASSGVIRQTNLDLPGVAWQPGGTSSVLGLSKDERDADNSVEREKFTQDGSASGNLEHDVTRKIAGIHVSVSHREAISDPQQAAASGLNGGDTTGPMQTLRERKVFYLDSDRGKSSGFADWEIFDASGEAVGADDGTTDTDTTPNEGLIGM